MRNPLVFLVLAAVIVAASTEAEGASRRRATDCEPEELISELRMTLDLRPIEAPPPQRRTDGRALCEVGSFDDAGCRPHQPLPGGQTVGSLFFFDASFAPTRAPAIRGAEPTRLSRDRSRAAALAAGHFRRIERPPRSF